MKRRIFVLLTLIVLAALTTVLLVPMINYVKTYNESYSFMTLTNAIITVVALSVIVLASLTGIVFVIIKMIILYKQNN